MASVNRHEIPVLISDEKEALLAAKAAGRAIIGLWRPEQDMDDLAGAKYIVEDMDDVTDMLVERVARRHLGLPWHICETDRIVIREIFADDFDEVWFHQIGRGFGTIEELEVYTKNQYDFYEFGFWALVEKMTGELIGVAGLTVPEDVEDDRTEVYVLDVGATEAGADMPVDDMDASGTGETLELGYHIFLKHRHRGFAKESCQAILKYGMEELGAERFIVRIDKENEASKCLARLLGFVPEP